MKCSTRARPVTMWIATGSLGYNQWTVERFDWRGVDVGHGWLIFKLPPSEVAVHPSDGENQQLHGGHRLLGAVLYLMCDDLHGYIKLLRSKNVCCTEISTEQWGIKTTIKLPSGGEIGLYHPTHPTALNL
jgi:hypothetical protein